ncbi:hypothetical protein NQ318_013521 [Aromia moschata]|uniref:C3H1-type domain-containing protein n=1 Tax=Aromia moschata TaxID=1265417 RepID=A0AAV8YBF6_9CUCU|nr:hypothetical protein NQ318_013521 [Aromia moschata]
MEETIRVVLAEDTAVPERSETILDAHLDGNPCVGNIMVFEPRSHDGEVARGIAVGKALLLTEKTVPVRIMNLNHHPKRRSETHLGRGITVFTNRKVILGSVEFPRLKRRLLKRVLEKSDGTEERKHLIVPRNRVPEVLEEIHNGSTGGHLGVTKTLGKVRERFYWVNCTTDVKEWCALQGTTWLERTTSVLSQRMDDIHERVRSNIQSASDRMKETYDINAKPEALSQSQSLKPEFDTSVHQTASSPSEEFMLLHSNGQKARYGVTREEPRDLFQAPADFCLAHCVAADLRMTRGIALTFKKAFGQLEELRRQRPEVGRVLQIKVAQQEKERSVFYLVTKQLSHHKPTYQTVWVTLVEPRDVLLSQNISSLAIPKIASGLDGLDWRVIRSMLEVLFRFTGIEILICCYNPRRSLNVKTVDCFFYQTSRCKNGPFCRYRHRPGDETIRDEMSLRRGQCYERWASPPLPSLIPADRVV